MMWWALAMLGVAGAIAAAVLKRGRPVAAYRAPGDRLVDLPQGATHAVWSGPADGPVVVAIHGLTTPSEVFEPIAERLATRGIRVLRYDLYGRGRSDSAREPETAAFFARQLSDLLEAERIRTPVTVLGYSMGGVIGTVFAARRPDRVSRLVLLAPAGMAIALHPFWRRARDWGVIGDAMVALFGERVLRAQVDTDGRLARVQLAQARRRDFPRSVLSSLRGALSPSLEPVHRRIAEAGIPVLAIWGARDRTIPDKALGRLAHWNRRARHETLDDADHALPSTHPDQIAELILREMAEARTAE